MSSGDGGQVDCGSCGEATPVDEAALLEARDSKGVWRYLCPDCLEALSVPKGYTVRRDLSFLRGRSVASTAEDGGTETDDAPTTVAEPRNGSSVVADFLGRVATADDPEGRLRAGRVLMDRRRIVLATQRSRTAIPLESVHDVAPADGSAEEAVIGIAYGSRGEAMAFVGAADDTLRRFMTVLFRALLSGTTVRARTEGARESAVDSGVLTVEEKRIEVSGTDVSVDLERVTDVEHPDREWTREDRAVLVIRHRRDGGPIASEFALRSTRTRDLLGRYVRERL